MGASDSKNSRTDKQKTGSYRYGLWTECVAALVLRLKGYRILARRYKTRSGEIDIIARRRKTIVFVEVKARRDLSTALESLDQRMQSRIGRAALLYIQRHPEYADDEMRFDFFAFSSVLKWRYLDNVWQMPT